MIEKKKKAGFRKCHDEKIQLFILHYMDYKYIYIKYETIKHIVALA